MRTVGIALWVLGLVVFVGGMFMPTTVPGGELGLEHIYNTGLLQQQLIVELAGLSLFLAGVIAHALSVVASALRLPTAADGEQIESAPPLTTATGPAYPITGEYPDEQANMDDIRLYGIERCADRRYRYGSRDVDTLGDALTAARAGEV